ncbi:MAG: TonB-dependent receptor [Hyphomonadaceae bacterium]
MVKRCAAARAYRAGAVVMGLLAPGCAFAQTAPSDGSSSSGALPDIVVTAEKRSASVNSVPMTITAVTADQLRALGVNEVADLARVVPGFQVSTSLFSSPVYTLRGVGFYEPSLGSRAAVALYLDEAPLPFAVMASGATMDLERVEVLNGPQGTLFGQNSSGGLVNYIAAKPTGGFSYGGSATYGRFNQGDVQGFVSGPITDTINARFAVKQTFGDGWQRSTTRDDTNGARDFLGGRLLLDWRPNDAFKAELNINGWRDHSETQAGQLIDVNAGSTSAPLDPGLVSHTRTPSDPRDADWTPGGYRRNASFYQGVLRLDYDVGDLGTLTSISAYSQMNEYNPSDPDGVPQHILGVLTTGQLASGSEELRFAGRVGDRLSYIVGASYVWDKADEDVLYDFAAGSARDTFVPLGFGQFAGVGFFTNARYNTTAVFGNLDYNLTDQLTAHFGIRYTETRASADACSYDTDGTYGPGLVAFENMLRASLPTPLPPVTLPANRCASFDENFAPGVAHIILRESNTPFRVGLDWRPADGTLIYANVSRGFKGGALPTLGGVSQGQFQSARQEEIIAYETGVKARLFDRTLQLNGAIFYYDYKDKQFEGRVIENPNIFGPLQAIVNIPESHVLGEELQVSWAPVEGVTLNASVTHLDTEIDGNYFGFDYFSNFVLMSGQTFPYAPEWSGVMDAEYRWPVHNGVSAFVGASARAQSHTRGVLGENPALSPDPNQKLKIDGYGTLDLRTGLEAAGGRWRLMLWGRNITNELYYTTATVGNDFTVAFAGMPATYGVTLSYRH